MAVSLQGETLIEEREALMVSSSAGKPSWKVAHFLKPSFPQSETGQTLLNPPRPISHPSKPIFQILKSLSSKVHFGGWRYPLKNWNSWVQKLRPSFESTWKKASIFEAIMNSMLEIPKCKASIFALAEQWSPETNTFVLPWGEITITLEDIMVLGGFSVKGDSVLSEANTKKLLEIEEKLLKSRLELNRSKYKKASQQQWLEKWMENGEEFEHEAFLSLWLSRYVLPADDFSTINKSVFQIAVLLARGTRIALAPAVLASIYRDLKLLKQKIATFRDLGDPDDKNVTKLVVWAPLQLLQIWVWERFPALSPKTSSLGNGLSRLGKWHKAKILRYDDVDSPIDFANDDFQWRPYSKPWNKLEFDYDLESYCRIIRVSDLVGLDCVEQYLPHRVARQFGLDQDIPIVFRRVCDTGEIAWSNYSRPIKDIKLYRPPKLFEANVTTDYLKWWGKSEVGKENAHWVSKKGDTNAKPCQDTSKVSMTVEERIRVKIENNEADIPPGFSSKDKRVAASESSDQFQPSPKRSRQSVSGAAIDIDSFVSISSCHSSSQIKELKAEDESDEDHLTLSQVFGVKRANRSGTLSVRHRDSPVSSAGDNTVIQETKCPANSTENILPSEECTRKRLISDDGSESNAGSPISIDKNVVQTSFNGACESSNIDLLDRIARLQRIIDMVKAAKITHI